MKVKLFKMKLKKNATIATYTIFRGFLNVVASDNDQCQKLFLCEGGLETASYGKTAIKIASLARYSCFFMHF